MSYVRAKVLDGDEDTGMVGWAEAGMMGWAEVGTSKVYTEFFTDYWYHKWGATWPRVEFETKEECMEWLEDKNAYDASDLQDNVNNPALTGGPAGYYDLPYKDWDTTNDMGEYLAKNRWFEYSLHFKDLLKALVRFGSKDGTTKRYDIEKMIYSGCRAMVMLAGREAVRGYLQKLLDDPQFKERKDL